jgi:hypothetical protein
MGPAPGAGVGRTDRPGGGDRGQPDLRVRPGRRAGPGRGIGCVAALPALLGRVRSPRYAHLQPILATEQDKAAGLRPPRNEPAEHGGYVRGADYYAGGAK